MSTSRINRLLIGAAAAVGVLAGAAGVTAAVTGGFDDPTPNLDRAEAEAAAVEEVPGTVVGIEADDEAGQAVWSVDVEGADGRRHEVDVADDGTVVGRDTDDDDEHDDDRPVNAEEATVTQAEAEATAVEAAPGEVRRSHLEWEDGLLVWDVEVLSGGVEHDVQVDATTGAVVEHDADDD